MHSSPDFLVLGAARAGTTALYSYLRQHPQVFMPKDKELNFFAFENQKLNYRGPGADYVNKSVETLADYRAYFRDSPENAICGEASPLYLFAPQAPARIRHHLPDVRMIVILRNPVEQAFSHFMYATKQCVENEADFTKALQLEEKRLADRWQPMFGYSAFPRYGDQLERYFALFPREQFLIRTYEEFQSDPQTLLRDVFEFIGADPDFSANTTYKPNAGGVPKNQAFQNFLMESNPITRAIGRVVPKETRLRIRDHLTRLNIRRTNQMSATAREYLHDKLDGDIAKLETMLDLDLAHWRL